MKTSSDAAGRDAPRVLVLCATVLFVLCSSHTVRADNQTYDATADFGITNGNPNGVWSYGWMATDFTGFTLFTKTSLGDGVNPNWLRGGGSDGTPAIWMNRTAGWLYGVPPNHITLHPGPGTEPSVLRWTAPQTGYYSVVGKFLAGDSGTMQVGVRANDAWLWQATDSGSFNILHRATVGGSIDFVVYGGYYSGNTPLELAITELRPHLTQIEMQEGAIRVTATDLIEGTTNRLQSRSDLLDGVWTKAAEFISTTAYTNLLHEDDGSAQRRFYRLVTE